MEFTCPLACVCTARGLPSFNLNYNEKEHRAHLNQYLLWTIMISFTFEQVISGFPAVGATSDTRTVATNSLLDAIKYFVQLLWDVIMMKLL